MSDRIRTVIARAQGDALFQAAKLIREGELVAFPTETVYGLGANALDAAAVKKIFEAKGRPQDNPLIVHVTKVSQVEELVQEIPENARVLFERFCPGPLTVILKKKPCVPDVVTAGLDTVAVRIPSHPDARALIDAAGLPIAAPSANRSGLPSPTRAEHVFKDMQGRIPMILDGGACTFGVESTVVDLSGDKPQMLRPGAVTLSQLCDAVGRVVLGRGVMQELQEGEQARSPGLLHKHYAPGYARVLLLEGSDDAIVRRVNELAKDPTHRYTFVGMTQLVQRVREMPCVDMGGTVSRYAAELFDTLRRLDDQRVDIIVCQAVQQEEMGLALMNRLLRAAGFNKESVE